MDEFPLLLLAVLVIGSAVVGMIIGHSRGRPGAGLLCGLFLGPLGCVVALFLPRDMPAAPPGRRPGAPTQRAHRLPVKGDPIEEWERKQRAAHGTPPPPTHPLL